MSRLPVVPNRTGRDGRDLGAIYEYLGRFRSKEGTRVATLEAAFNAFTAKRLTGSTTWDPGDLATGAQTTTTVTVTGAALGDTVLVGFSLSLQALQLTGYVSATDTVTVVLQNGTGGNIDLGSGTLRADVWKA